MTNESNTTAEYPPLPKAVAIVNVDYGRMEVPCFSASQMRAYVDADRAARAQAAQPLHTGPCGQCGVYEQLCACKINAILAERGSVAVNKENYLKLVQKAQAAQAVPTAADEWIYRRYGSEPEKGYAIVSRGKNEINGTPIAYLGDGELAAKAADAICDAHNAAVSSVSVAQAVPAGWKLVPVEPTEAMLDAAAHASMQHLLDCINDPAKAREVGSEENVRKTHASRYRSMLGAAPSDPVVPAAVPTSLPEPDFTLDGGSVGCYYESTVRRFLAAQPAEGVPFGYVNISTGQFFKDVEPCRKNNEGHWKTVYTHPKEASQHPEHPLGMVAGAPAQEDAGFRDSTDKSTVVSDSVHWRPIDANTPRGAKIQLINKNAGVATYGRLETNNFFWTHWAPLPTFKD